MRSLPHPALSVAATLALASCVSAPPPRPQPQPRAPIHAPPPAPAPAPPRADWRDWPLTPGDWVYRQDGRGSIALFGASGADALLTLRCDRDRGTIYLSRAGAAAGPMTLRTSTLARTLIAAPTGASPAYVAVAITPNDGLLDAIGFSRGRFIVEQPGAETLVVPAYAEIERVTEDCR